MRIESAGSSVLLSIQHLPYRLCGLQEEPQIKLTTSQETLTLASVKRPRGVLSWGHDDEGIWVQSPILCGFGRRWQANELVAMIENGFTERRLVEHRLPTDIPTVYKILTVSEHSVSSEVGFSLDKFGIYAMVQIFNEQGFASQGLRWIEPGTFWMGSPDDEPERRDDEGPRHEVTISQGFWLADTACTQALWQAVMGNNPSRFKNDPQQPVEQVSWHDVQTFLQRLQALLPGCQVDLPSEAEWEYACRAGTGTAFSFGANITPQQANYEGYPHFGGKKGEYREKTVPVKSLPANPWGLYEMHGNVWEWCKDGQRTYDGQAQIDPLEPLIAEEEPRAVRGGSWNYYARRTRSAIRNASPPGDADYYLGFRFCLRSMESGQEQVSPDAVQGTSKSSDSSIKSKLSSLFKPNPKPKR